MITISPEWIIFQVKFLSIIKIPLLRKTCKARNHMKTSKIYQKYDIENNHFEMDDPVVPKLK